MESMTVVMDRRIEKHLLAIDPITSRKRIFAFMADKFTELHRRGDTVALMAMSEGGELEAVFYDYLLVTSHIGKALMTKIYDKNFVKKLKLKPADIRDQCTGPGFTLISVVPRFYQGWWLKTQRELQQPRQRLTALWNGFYARGTRHFA